MLCSKGHVVPGFELGPPTGEECTPALWATPLTSTIIFWGMIKTEIRSNIRLGWGELLRLHLEPAFFLLTTLSNRSAIRGLTTGNRGNTMKAASVSTAWNDSKITWCGRISRSLAQWGLQLGGWDWRSLSSYAPNSSLFLQSHFLSSPPTSLHASYQTQGLIGWNYVLPWSYISGLKPQTIHSCFSY